VISRLRRAVERRRYIWTNSARKTSASLSRLISRATKVAHDFQPAPSPANGLLIGALTKLD
jgi:hypothetical protein